MHESRLQGAAWRARRVAPNPFGATDGARRRRAFADACAEETPAGVREKGSAANAPQHRNPTSVVPAHGAVDRPHRLISFPGSRLAPAAGRAGVHPEG